MRNVMFVVLLFCAATKLTAQTTYDEFWAFGYNCGMGFKNDTANAILLKGFAITNSAAIAAGGDSTRYYFTNDSLFTIFPSEALQNFSSPMFYDSGYKTCALVPKGHNTFYLITMEDDFTKPCNNAVCLDLVIWDLSVIDDNWVSVNRREIINDGLLVEARLNVVRHANGLDWWLVVHKMKNKNIGGGVNQFITYLLTVDSVLGPFIQSIGTVHNIEELYFGDLAISNSGKKVAISLTEVGIIDVFDFDRCTGRLSNHVSVFGGSAKKYGGIEFSEGERFLYTVTGRGLDPNKLYQYDLTQSNIASSEVLLWDEPDYVTYRTGSLKRGPNGKIYLSSYVDDTTLNNAHRKLGVIHEPDSAGLACNFVPFDFELLPSCRVYFGLPNIPNYNLGATSIYQADAGVDTFLCISDTVAKGMSIGSDSVPGVSYEWLNVDASNVNKYNSRAFVAVDSTTWFYLQLTDTTIKGSCQTRIDSVLVERKLCTGIEEIGQAEVRVYPNPAHNEVNIEMPSQGRMELYDLSGRLLLNQPLTKGSNRVVLQANSLSYGMLIYKVYQSGTLVLTDKLVLLP